VAKHELDLLYVKNPTAKSKTVKWAGVPYTLAAGQQIIWQRFLAEHFAKHLANDILLLRESQHKKDYLANGGHLTDYKAVAYLNSKKHRPPVISSILIGTYQYHKPQGSNDPSSLIQQQIDAVNQQAQPSNEPPPMDLGTVNDDRTGDHVKTEFDNDEESEDGLAAALTGQEPITTQPAAPQSPAPQPIVPEPPQQPAPQPAAQMSMQQPTIPPMAPPVAPSQPAAPQTLDENAKRPQLMAEAAKLGIKVPFGAKNEDIKNLIKSQFA